MCQKLKINQFFLIVDYAEHQYINNNQIHSLTPPLTNILTDMINDNRNLQQQLHSLISTFNPTSPINSSFTKHCIIVTSMINSNICSTLSPQSTPKLMLSRSGSQDMGNMLPSVHYLSKQQSMTVINGKKYLLPSNANQYPNISCINFIYLMTIYSSTRILLTFTTDDFMDQKYTNLHGCIKNIQRIIQTQAIMMKECEEFWNCFGILVQGVQNGKQQQNICKDKFKNFIDCISKNNTYNTQVINIIKSIIQHDYIYFSSPKQKITDFISEVTKITPFNNCPKSLTVLYKQLLQPGQLTYLKQQISKVYMQGVFQTFNVLIKAIQQQQIFQQQQQLRNDALYINVYNQINLKIQTPQYIKKESLKRIDHFVVQAVFFILAELQKMEEDFYHSDINYDYVTYNQKNQSCEWQSDIINMSVMGWFLQKFFSKYSLYCSIPMNQYASYLHIFFRVFENVPGIDLRAHEKSLIPQIHKIMQKLLQFLYQNLNTRVSSIIQKSITPLKLMNLTYDIKKLMDLLNKFQIQKRQPYLTLAQQIPQKLVYIATAYFFCAWKCYQTYQNFWSKQQKNDFMIQLYTLCKNQLYMQYLEHQKKQQALKVVRKMNQYFGDLCSKKKQYFMAVKFYLAAKLNWKLIQTYNHWLQKILQSQYFNIQDIQKGVKKLSQLGITEQARKWCYKFMDKFQQNSQLISLLEDIADFQRNQNKMILQEIKKLKYDNIQIVSKDIMDVVIKEIARQQWLTYR